MKQVFTRLSVLLLILAVLAPIASADVLLSELCDPRNDYLTDRYIEIYNSGPSVVDLTGWKIVALGNGAEIFTWNLSGSIAPGQALVAGDANPVDTFPVDFPQAAWSDNNATWNGKVGDGARLKNASNVTVDDIEVPTTVFENQTLERNANITTPSLSYNAAEWTATPVDLPSEATPGYHHSPPTSGPVLGSIVTVPASPAPGQTVDVQAVVTDASAAITGVTLNWGTTSGALGNAIVMTNIGGDTFETVTPIPAQVSGITIYYAVTAANDVPDQTVSSQMSYYVYLDNDPPVVLSAYAPGPTLVELTFSEALDPVSSQNAANYALAGGSVSQAVQAPGNAALITLTVSTMASGSQTLTVNGVEDLLGNATSGLVVPFTYYGGNVPAGYYDSAEGLTGETLRGALHLIIDYHSSVSYDYLWTAFYSTDAKPNGKVWDMYSDVPGGIPPYEYTFGVDQGGTAGSEGSGYNREHSWPSSWYGATSPMYTDIFMVYPTDNEVNNKRGSYPFGEVSAPTWTSLNGCRLGSCSYPGYTGTVFEPIDEYKGDFARAYFYMTTRYYTEDGSWSSNDMVDRSVLKPWAEAMLLEWHAADPVSAKEIERNDAVYDIQSNRNPFIDRPDFVGKIYQPGLSPVLILPVADALVLYQNVPNPFNPSTTISYELDEAARVQLQVFDISGRLVRNVFQGGEGAGRHSKVWLGRDQQGRTVAAGVYFYRVQADGEIETRRMLLAK